MVKKVNRDLPEKRPVTTGITDEQFIEITGGLNIDDVIIVTSAKLILQTTESSKNPFMPEPPGAKKK